MHYDPAYSFLSFGVVSAIHEIEYMRMVRKKFNPSMTQYHLGELVLSCGKVNYKMNYRPGQVACPRTKEWVPIEKALPKMEYYSKLSMEEKKAIPHRLSLVDCPGLTKNEREVLELEESGQIMEFPILLNQNSWIKLRDTRRANNYKRLILNTIEHFGY